MITLNNSNIDFDIDSSNSILLFGSNLVFRTKTLNRMTITNNGNVGIGTEIPIAPLQVAGNVNSTGLITSTGEGFEGSGFKLYNIPIDAVNNLGITLQSLSGNTESVIVNVTGTSNALVNRIKEETLLGSNYTLRVNTELNASLNTASNNLVNRIMMEVGRGSNYTLATSNTLTTRVMDEVALGSNYTGRLGNNISNYIVTSSNTLVNRVMDEVALGSNYTGRLGNNISNYIVSTSNTLTTRVMDEVNLGSNYTGRLGNNISNYIVSTSNTLTTRVMDEVNLGSNYTGRLGNNISNYIVTSSNTLVNRVMDEVALGSNYTGRLGNNISNYIVTSSNTLVNRVMDEVALGSNYTGRLGNNISNYIVTSSNTLVNRIMDEVALGSNYTGRLGNNISNYIVSTSNTLVNRIMDEVALGSNYTGRLGNNISNYIVTSSNTLVNRIMDEVALGSNYTGRLGNNISNYIVSTSNILVNRVIEEVVYGSNYTTSNMTVASNILVNRIMTEVGFGSNFAKDKVGVWGSNYTDLSGKWGSNYTEKLHAVALVSSQWATSSGGSGVIYYNAGNIGIGTTTPVNILHIYSSNNSLNFNNNNLANSKITIQESNTSNSFSSYPSDITSSPSVAPVAIEGTTDKYMVFPYTTDNTGTLQTQYTITLPENYSCDILLVGGGGGGGGDIGGGGGGGAVLYGSNVIIPSGTYNIKVGNGGAGTGQNGYNTEAFGAVCLGGGGAKNIQFDSATVTSNNNGNMGGSGGGGKATKTGTAGIDFGTGGGVGVSTIGALFASASSLLYNGFVGGNGVKTITTAPLYQSGGGGGASSKGGEGKPNGSGEVGQGGNGVEVNIVALPDKNNPLCWGAGGGGGSAGTSGGVGGKGGGGSGSGTGTIATNTANAYNSSSGLNAGAGTGSGGGGGGLVFQSNGGNGGSGIIIIRYRDIIGVKGTPEMQLVIGNNISAGCSNYKIGNYNGDFQIKTSTSNIDKSSFVIQGNANVGVGTSRITSKLHVYDNNFNAILTLQDNTSLPITTTPNIITASAAPPLSTSVVSSYYTVPVPPAAPIYEGLLIMPYTTDSTGYVGQSRYTFTTNEDINADILVVAGGGAGASFGGGGGSGQVLLTTGYNIASGVSVSVNVGRGGIGNSTPFAIPPIPIPGIPDPQGMNGAKTVITIGTTTITADGGGAGGSCSFTSNTSVGIAGGSGGGSSSGYSIPASLGGASTKSQYQYFNWKSFGNSGGIGTYRPGTGSSNIHFSGAGGGAGYLGANGFYTTGTSGISASGGVGIDLSAIFGTSAGALGWFGGGGGGMSFGTAIPGGAGGTGGGGQGAAWSASILNGLNGANGVSGTGGGGGGGNVRGGDGGSGIVIMRFRRRNLEGNSEIQLIKGASISTGNTNYKIGNYGGDYKIKTASYNTDTDRFVIQSDGNTRFNNTSGLAVATIFNNGDFRTAGSQISDSDNRIKRDVKDIDVGRALQMILAVEPKTYRYIDEERSVKGRSDGCDGGDGSDGSDGSDGRDGSDDLNTCVYGFIAQQIKGVIPNATETQKDFLPNIMKRAVRDKNRVYLDLTGYQDLPSNVGDDRKINIRFKNGKNGGGYNFDILEVNKDYFVIDTADKHIEEVFVYGYEVNDFHKLTKDYIYTLNVSATQELHRKMKSQDERIKELEDKLERLLG